jgi:hypothetical protein
VIRIAFSFAIVVALTQVSPTGAQRAFEGIWNSATATPLERPRELKDKAFFTPEEATAWERRTADANAEPADDAPRRGTGTYNTVYREFGTRVMRTRRTSIVIYPPDGRIPALTLAAAEVMRQHRDRQRSPDHPEDMGLQDQCLAFETAGPPMLPYSYNSNYQFVVARGAIVIHVEMNHDARIIHMDRRVHPSSAVRLWLGDSIGSWEGETLVVDSTNFTDERGYYGDAGGNFAWDRNLHLTERFRLLDRDTMLYQFDVDDPTAYVQPWKGELTLARSTGQIYEYACHEANYSLANILRATK